MYYLDHLESWKKNIHPLKMEIKHTVIVYHFFDFIYITLLID